jgi:hypothetical protein
MGITTVVGIRGFRVAGAALLGLMLAACGGGGGGGDQASPPVIMSNLPLQVYLKNIYANNWSKSGVISGTYLVPGGCYGSFCQYTSSGTFTRTTSISGLKSTTNYSEVIDGNGLNKSYTVEFSSDYSKVAFGSCVLNLPASIEVGYTQVGTCSPTVSITVTPPSFGGSATLTLNSVLGSETYAVESNGSVTPIKVAQSGQLFGDYRSYTLTLAY